MLDKSRRRAITRSLYGVAGMASATLAVAACGSSHHSTSNPSASSGGGKSLVSVKFTGPANPPPGVTPQPLGLAGYAISLGDADKALNRYGFSYGGYVSFENTTEADAAIQSGSAQLVSQGQAPAILAKAGGASLTVIGAGTEPDTTWVLVPKGSQVTDISQLKGKTVGAGFGTNFEQGFLWGLKNAGVDPKDVKLENIVVNTGEAALKRGAVDGFATSTTLGQLWSKAGYPVIWKSQDHPADAAATVTMVQSSFAEAHPRIQQAWWALYRAGLAAYEKDPAAFYKWEGEQYGLTAAQAKVAGPVVLQTTPIEPNAVTVLKDGLSFFLSVGQAQKSFSVDDWLIAPAKTIKR